MAFFAGKSASDAIFVYEMMTLQRGSEFQILVFCFISFVMKSEDSKKSGLSESFVMGVVAVVFLLVGYQTALFIHRAAVTKIAAERDAPDTVYVYREVVHVERKNAEHHPRVESVRSNMPRAKVESFAFNPNTVTLEELCRLGFSQKQAESIINYRSKGGVFHRKEG